MSTNRKSVVEVVVLIVLFSVLFVFYGGKGIFVAALIMVVYSLIGVSRKFGAVKEISLGAARAVANDKSKPTREPNSKTLPSNS